MRYIYNNFINVYKRVRARESVDKLWRNSTLYILMRDIGE